MQNKRVLLIWNTLGLTLKKILTKLNSEFLNNIGIVGKPNNTSF